MTPAKKRKAATPKKPCPPLPSSPTPVLTAPQKRTWTVFRKSTAIGALFIALGVGILGGHWFYHREWHTPSFVGASVLLLLGALLVEPAAVKDALLTLGGVAKDLLPFTRRGDPPPAKGGEK